MQLQPVLTSRLSSGSLRGAADVNRSTIADFTTGQYPISLKLYNEKSVGGSFTDLSETRTHSLLLTINAICCCMKSFEGASQGLGVQGNQVLQFNFTLDNVANII